MPARTLLVSAFVVALLLCGCASPFATEPTSTASDSPPTAELPVETVSQTVETAVPTTTKTAATYGTSRTRIVLLVESEASEPHNVTIRLQPDGGEERTESFVLEPSDSYEVPREADVYAVEVLVDGETVFDKRFGESEEYYVTIRSDGSVGVDGSVV
ncbi:hypothetical protein [Haloarchaeobius sp. DFWS5]|uniref:hypothetical protein n=1 Tax=Haloarchaeobius sp. DFWS5 TaxID=3446114 RepID=UPI003EBE5993